VMNRMLSELDHLIRVKELNEMICML